MKRYFTALYPYNATDFWSQGYGVISDALSSVTTESANSNGSISYQLEMTYPKNGPLASKLVEGNLIRCTESSDPNKFMIFEIVESNKADTGTLTIYGEAYPNRVRRMTFKNGGKFKTFNSPQEAINAGIGQIDGWPADFVVTCEVSGKLDFRDEQGNPTIFEDFGAFLDAINDAIHGEVEYTAWNRVRIYSKRGRDRKDEIQLRDDKNISGVTVKTDHSSIINVIVPLIPIKDAEGNPTAETKVGKVVKSAKPFEFINYYAGKVVQVDTQELANSYFNRTHSDRPSVTVDVDPEVNEEDLTSLQLFDTVTLYSKSLGYSTSIRVAQRDFDNLTGRVSHFSLGSSGSSIFTSSSSEIEQLKQQVTAAQNAGQVALVTADGKNQFFPESTDPPQNPREGDIWFKRDGDVVRLMQFHNGDWVEKVSDTTGKEITDKVNEAMNEMAEHVADINKNQIDISKIKTDISKAQGDITQVRQDAKEDLDKLQSTVNKDLDDAKKQAKMAYDETSRVESQAKEALESAVEAKETSVNLQTSVNDLTGELASKADKTTVNTLDRTVKNQATEISQNTKELKAKASSSEVDLLRGTVSENSTQISQNSTALKGKANTTDLNKVSGDLVTLTNNFNVTSKGFEADISQVNSRVADTNKQLTVAKADIKATADNLSTNYTKTTDEHNYVNSQIKQSADKINLSVASVSDKVDGMEIGGRNLISNSSLTKDLNGWSTSMLTPTDDYTIWDIPNKASSRRFVSYYFVDITNDSRFGVGKDYTLSADLYVDSVNEDHGTDNSIFARAIDKNGSMLSNSFIDAKLDLDSKGWHRYSDTNKLPEGTVKVQISFAMSADTFGKFRIKNAQFEKGTKATDWTPAPEDTDSKIAALQITDEQIKSTVSNKADTSYVDQKAGEISSTVGSVAGQLEHRNYLAGTYDAIRSLHTTNSRGFMAELQRDITGFALGKTLTYSMWHKESTHTGYLCVQVTDVDGVVVSYHSDDALYNDYKWLSITFTVPKDAKKVAILGFIYADKYSNSSYFLNYKREKLEIGAQATDWTPSPEDTDNGFTNVNAAISKVSQKADSISTTVANNQNANNAKFSNLEQNLNGFKTTVYSKSDVDSKVNKKADSSDVSNQLSKKADVSQITQLSDKINLKVNQTDFDNMIYDNRNYLTDTYDTIKTVSTTNTWGVQDSLNRTVANDLVGSTITYSMWHKESTHTGWLEVALTDKNNKVTNYHSRVCQYNEYALLSVTISIPTGTTKINVRGFVYKGEFPGNNILVYKKEKLEKGAKVTDWAPAPEDLTTADNVVSQINIDKSGVLIQGKKIMIDGDATIKNAVIKSSMIDTLDASKITAGTLNAANVNIINMNVSKLVGDKTNFVQSAWNGVSQSVMISPAGLLSLGLSGFVSLTETGMNTFANVGDNYELVGNFQSATVAGTNSTNGSLVSIEPSGDFIGFGQRTSVKDPYSMVFTYWRNAGAGYKKGLNSTEDIYINSAKTLYAKKWGTIDAAKNAYVELGATSINKAGNYPVLGNQGLSSGFTFQGSHVWMLSGTKNLYDMTGTIKGFSGIQGKTILLPTEIPGSGQYAGLVKNYIRIKLA